ncbi:MAG TPA: GxxExxY protein [Anaerolineae bacterium]|nr:GxxExxY protein [Anaerolineae bacterium]HQK12725.1 GxxExxY protein [Anaerolineae bacterium]
MADAKLLHADLTYAIRGAIFDVGNHLEPGLPEKYYQEALSIGLERRNLRHTLEAEYHVFYRDIEVGRYYCDVVVEDKVVVELKVAPELTPLHRMQLLSYLRVTGADVGLLVNFGAARVEIERYAGFYACNRPAFFWRAQSQETPDLLYPELVGRIYACLYRVHYELGPGFIHHVYRRAVQVELSEQNLPYLFVREIPVTYEGELLGTKYCRLLIVDDKVIVAAFAVCEMTGAYDVRMRRYLDYFGMQLGLLANFHGEQLEVRPVRVGEKNTDVEIHDEEHGCRNTR